MQFAFYGYVFRGVPHTIEVDVPVEFAGSNHEAYTPFVVDRDHTAESVSETTYLKTAAPAEETMQEFVTCGDGGVEVQYIIHSETGVCEPFCFLRGWCWALGYDGWFQ